MEKEKGFARRDFLKSSMLAGSGILVGSRLLTDGGYEVQAQPSDSVAIRLRVNGTNYGLRVDPRTSLLDLLREKLDLPGTKKGCNHGQCGSVHGGSGTTASVGSAIHEAALAVRAKLLTLASNDKRSPLHGATEAEVTFADGRISLKNDPPRGEAYGDILRRNRMSSIEATVDSKPGDEDKKFSMHAFCAHFVELRVDADLGSIRVSRVVSTCGAGRIMNEKTARSQMSGGVVGGLGMALMEETVMDHRMGRFVNASLGEYHVPVNADSPSIEAFFVEERDAHVNPLGAKGIGEVSYVGVAAAVANAVFHATGKRIRQLPITLDKLL